MRGRERFRKKTQKLFCRSSHWALLGQDSGIDSIALGPHFGSIRREDQGSEKERKEIGFHMFRESEVFDNLLIEGNHNLESIKILYVQC